MSKTRVYTFVLGRHTDGADVEVKVEATSREEAVRVVREVLPSETVDLKSALRGVVGSRIDRLLSVKLDFYSSDITASEIETVEPDDEDEEEEEEEENEDALDLVLYGKTEFPDGYDNPSVARCRVRLGPDDIQELRTYESVVQAVGRKTRHFAEMLFEYGSAEFGRVTPALVDIDEEDFSYVLPEDDDKIGFDNTDLYESVRLVVQPGGVFWRGCDTNASPEVSFETQLITWSELSDMAEGVNPFDAVLPAEAAG